MKRFLITLTGRANCIYGKLRGNELVCSYVHANSKKKAVELFWGEIEKNENFNCYSRRDFKIEAELWNEDELDSFGNPLKDWESAIEFSNLHLIRFNHCTGKYELADEPQESSEHDAQENIQPEPEKATESNSEPHSQPIHHLKGAPRLISESKRKEIPFEEIRKWNQMWKSAQGSNTYYVFNLYHEGRDEHGRWFKLGHSNIRAHMIPHPSDHYYIKKIKDEIWIYFEQCGTVEERWLMGDVAKAYFLHESWKDYERFTEESSQELSEGSQEDEKEIIQPEPKKATESDSKPSGAKKFIYSNDYESMEEIAKGFSLEECFDQATDSIIIPDSYFECVDVFILDLFRNRADLILRCDEDENHKKAWHIERASQSSQEEEKEIIKENAQELTQSKSEAHRGNGWHKFTKKGKLTRIIGIKKDFLMAQEVKTGDGWAYYVEGEFIWSSAERFSPDDLSKMYENGYFMEELKKRRAKLARCAEHSSEKDAVYLRNKIDEIDDEIARLFINGAEMKKEDDQNA